MTHATHTPLAQRVASLSDRVFGVGMTLLAYDVAFPKDAGVHDTFVAPAPRHLESTGTPFWGCYCVGGRRTVMLRGKSSARGPVPPGGGGSFALPWSCTMFPVPQTESLCVAPAGNPSR